MRLANVAVKKGDEVSTFMLGKDVLYEKSSNDQFNVIEQVNQFRGDFLCLRGLIERPGPVFCVPDP